MKQACALTATWWDASNPSSSGYKQLRKIIKHASCIFDVWMIPNSYNPNLFRLIPLSLKGGENRSVLAPRCSMV